MAFVPGISVTARGSSAATSISGATLSGYQQRVCVCVPGGRRGTISIRRYGYGYGHATTPAMHLDKTISETMTVDCVNKTLLALCGIAGVDLADISGTIFAPSETALSRLPAGTIEWFTANPHVLRSILLRHVLPGTVVTTKEMSKSGVGYFEGVFGGSLPYEGLGPIIKVGGQRVIVDSSNRECSNGIIHAIDGVIIPRGVTLPTFADIPADSVVATGDSVVASVYPAAPTGGRASVRALGATAPSTQGGRKAMGLLGQLPFWMYGPPFNASKQEDLEPISLVDTISSSVDYQVLPAGAVVVTPDEVSGDKLNPISGMSKYLGKGKRIVGGDAQSKNADILEKGM